MDAAAAEDIRAIIAYEKLEMLLQAFSPKGRY